jgi:glycosyltransferase involved in cell wall biosynthesis
VIETKSCQNKPDFPRLRVFATWRGDLCFINKARDNHFKFLGEHFDFTLLVPSGSIIGEHILNSSIRLVSVQCPSNALAYIWFYLYAIGFFVIKNTSRPYDAVWATICEEPIGWLLKLLSMRRVKLVYDLWDIPGSAVIDETLSPKELIRKLYQKFLSYTLRHCDLAISGVHPEGLERFRIPKDRMVFSENGVLFDRFDPEKVVPNKEIWADLNGRKRVFYHGYLHLTRGTFDLVEAIHLVRKLDFDVCLMLVGPSDSVTIRRLHSLVKSLRLENNIQILDSVPSDGIPGIIAGADICVCPLWDIEKYRWSYPVKIYEYLSMGKPVIASELPGIEEVIKHELNGLSYPPGDINALQESIVRLIQNQSLYLSVMSSARKSVANKDWQKLVKKIAWEASKSLAI